MKLLRAFIVFVLCAAAQSALAHLVPVYRIVRVDFCLIVLVGYAFHADAQRGFALGVLAGLATDLLGSGHVGASALGYGAVGFVIGDVQRTLFKEHALTRVVVVLVSAALVSVVGYYVLRVYEPTHNYLVELKRTLAPSAAATALVALFALGWMERRRRD